MVAIRAQVQNGRLVVDEATDLPDGTELELVVDDGGDDLTDEDRQLLHDAISASWESAKAGRVKPASEVMDRLKARR